LHKMLAIATNGVAWSVCLPVCWSRSWTLEKGLNWSTCCLGKLIRVDSRNNVLVKR